MSSYTESDMDKIYKRRYQNLLTWNNCCRELGFEETKFSSVRDNYFSSNRKKCLGGGR